MLTKTFLTLDQQRSLDRPIAWAGLMELLGLDSWLSRRSDGLIQVGLALLGFATRRLAAWPPSL